MKSAWLIPVLVSASRLLAADVGPTPLAAVEFLALFQDLRDAEAQKAGGTARHVSFRISSNEIDDYMRWSLKSTPRPGLESVTVKFSRTTTFRHARSSILTPWKNGSPARSPESSARS
jgi:hypothetical protein